jgi:hypothetical protein
MRSKHVAEVSFIKERDNETHIRSTSTRRVGIFKTAPANYKVTQCNNLPNYNNKNIYLISIAESNKLRALSAHFKLRYMPGLAAPYFEIKKNTFVVLECDVLTAVSACRVEA